MIGSRAIVWLLILLMGLGGPGGTALQAQTKPRSVPSRCFYVLTSGWQVARAFFGSEDHPTALVEWKNTKRPASTKVLSLLPRTSEEYDAIFTSAKGPGKDNDQKQKEIAAVASVESRVSHIESSAALTDAIRKSSESVLILMAHNVEHNLQTRSGSGIGIHDVLEECAKNGKVCVILGCRSTAGLRSADTLVPVTGIGLAGSISIEAALNMADKLTERLKTRQMTTASEIEADVVEFERAARVVYYAESVRCHGVDVLVAGILIMIARAFTPGQSLILIGDVIRKTDDYLDLAIADQQIRLIITMGTRGKDLPLVNGVTVRCVVRSKDTQNIVTEISIVPKSKA